MEHSYKSLIKTAQKSALIGIAVSATLAAVHMSSSASSVQSSGLERQVQVNHARELMGPRYVSQKAIASVSTRDIENFIASETESSLPAQWKSSSRAIAKAIISESRRYNWDPLFLMAVVKTESRFHPDAKGRFGEIGLMQVKPTTAKWMIETQLHEKKQALAEIKKGLYNPAQNIVWGAAYFSYLRSKLSGVSYKYIAAYNMGLLNLRRSKANGGKLTAYPKRVLGNYTALYAQMQSGTTATKLASTFDKPATILAALK